MVKSRRLPFVLLALATAFLGGSGSALLGVCGPFADVAGDAFCPFVLEIFALGITTGTSPTTYDPTASVTRLQMAAFLSRSVDGLLRKGSRRAAMNRFWTPKDLTTVRGTVLGTGTQGAMLVQTDGADLWVTNNLANTISRVRASDGKLLGTWTGALSALGVLSAGGEIYATGNILGPHPGHLYLLHPEEAPGAVITLSTSLGYNPIQMAFDGSTIWTANLSGSVSRYNRQLSSLATVTAGFQGLMGILFDGSFIWTTDQVAGTLLKLDAAGAILQTVTTGISPRFAVFDGTNIWVPNTGSNSVTVVRASTGAVLATLTGNGLNGPEAAAFDGERTLVTNTLGDSASLWKTADFTTLGSVVFAPGTAPTGVCSDGLNFWIAFYGNGGTLRRF